ncbi:MAG: sodium:proton antiporter [Elusimicrobia bacterium CG_4_9_14_3_um_filter_62_55]|nr:MAG: sodium:proton antiporter [Elusimicrobia bacterium CG22_combo_CG10-13_8_21_14_all_63_91]PJA11896.1 MAG: sodium:proton antiporter [Elusimicrobia bacterium CG_4_10_14_0_2_um_filter_63_34]PJB24802.1 MAG: sodium:proton antiporter [Elusimicrobia bacterium CG_4_9_14_3_um_filter_62_55]
MTSVHFLYSRAVNLFDTAAILTVLAAAFGVFNERVLRLPSTIGTMLIALSVSLLAVLLDGLFPFWGLRASFDGFLLGIDFNRTLMQGMLSFLLFAGALHVDLEQLLKRRWVILSLAVFGVLISTAIVGAATYFLLRLAGFATPPTLCLVFGALISPTDPVAVLGLLKEMKASPELEAQIAGESLFNDGIGVVVFLAAVALAGLAPGQAELTASGVAALFMREVLGGIALGLLSGFLAYRALLAVKNHSLELLITLALVLGCYSLCIHLHASGPIAVVLAGLFIGNHGKRFAMSEDGARRIGDFWNLLDEFLNALLFLLVGLEIFIVHPTAPEIAAGLVAIPVVLLARFAAVGLPISALNLQREFAPGIIPILTWGGLRGGISVALALSLPEFPGKRLLLTATFAVVLFSVLVQGLSIGRLVRRYR